MEIKKKISLMLVLILIMQVILPCLTVLFENGFTIISRAESTENYEWDISATDEDNVKAVYNEETKTLTISGTGEMKDFSNSNTTPWYSIRENIKKVIINGGVISIGDSSFRDCSTLTNVMIPEGVKAIGTYAFRGCSSLENIMIPGSITSIEGWAFHKCSNLSNIEFPANVTNIGNAVLSDCSNLENISVDVNNIYYKSESGILFNKDGTKIIQYPAGRINNEYEIPNGVTNINYASFEGCNNLKHIKIPESVTCIEAFAFNRCSNLEKIILPQGLTSIGEYAFRECSNLINVIIPEGVMTIENSVFRDCSSLIYVMIPEGIKTIGKYAFRGCSSLENIMIPSSITSIESWAFHKCSNLSNIEIPANVTNIGNAVLSDCSNLENISVDVNNIYYKSESGILFNKDGTKIIQYPAGRINNEYEIPEGVTNINYASFEGCNNLKHIKIPSGVTDIGSYAFYGCSNLEEVIIPEGVSTIGTQAFSECENIKNLVFSNIIQSKGDNIQDYKIIQISPKTTVQEFSSNIETNAQVKEIYDGETKITDEETLVGTGMILKLALNNDVEEYTLVVTGDLEGNGKMDDIDLLRMVRYKAGLDKTLQGIYLEAADIVKDNKPAEDNDLLKMTRILAKLDTF